MPKCTVCHHPQHLEINQAILSGDFTLAALRQKYGLSSSALQRHKDHIEVKMSRTRRRLREIREQASLLLLNDVLEQVRRGIAAAEAQGNYLAVFRGSHVASRIIHQLNRMEGDMKLDTLHRLISSPAWVPRASLLPTDPGLITDLHQALLDGVFLPCPEASPASPDYATDDDDAPAAAASDIATLRRLQELLPDLDLNIADLPPRTQELPKNKREISEKSAGKVPPRTEISLQNHIDTQSEKKLPKNPECAPSATALAATVATTNASPIPSPETEIPSPQTVFSPETQKRQPKICFSDPSVASAPRQASVGRESEADPAFLENDVPPTVSATASPQETLDESQAAELAAYLAEFPPYARPAQAPQLDPCPPDPGITDPKSGESSPPNQQPETRTSNPSRLPNFGNPGLFQSMKGNFM
jgi:hypothetical protein